jgi:hypothetical protein
MATDPNAVPDELYALRSRVAAQDAELTRLQGLVGRLADSLRDMHAIAVQSLTEFSPDDAPCGDTCTVPDLLAEARAEVPR